MPHYLLGVDEAGRGSWAGPVVAAACALRSDQAYDFSELLDDSKKLSPKKREIIFQMIEESIAKGECYGGVGVMSSEIIDQVGIREANRMAMEEALRQVLAQIDGDFDLIKIDGRDNYRFKDTPSEKVLYIVRGDSFVPEIQAASILAKVSRDHIMEELAVLYPNYGLERHKGYGTRLHENLLATHRPSEIHRKTYAPIKRLTEEDMQNISN
jgi:ribonuclease HII